jgi:hypothetical protein
VHTDHRVGTPHERKTASARAVAIGALGVLMLSVTGSCQRTTAPWSFDENIDLVIVMGDSTCIALANSSVPANSRVHIVDVTGQREFPAVVASREACGSPNSGRHGYDVRMTGVAPQTPFVGLVIVGSVTPFRMRGADITSDLDGDGHDEFFRSCTSAEGVHATIWSDAPLTGRRRWHGYHALGYDVTPTCTASEVSEP